MKRRHEAESFSMQIVSFSLPLTVCSVCFQSTSEYFILHLPPAVVEQEKYFFCEFFFSIFQLLSRTALSVKESPTMTTIRLWNHFQFRVFQLLRSLLFFSVGRALVLISQWRLFSFFPHFFVCTFPNGSRYCRMKNSQFTWLETIIASHFIPPPRHLLPSSTLHSSALMASIFVRDFILSSFTTSQGNHLALRSSWFMIFFFFFYHENQILLFSSWFHFSPFPCAPVDLFCARASQSLAHSKLFHPTSEA